MYTHGCLRKSFASVYSRDRASARMECTGALWGCACDEPERYATSAAFWAPFVIGWSMLTAFTSSFIIGMRERSLGWQAIDDTASERRERGGAVALLNLLIGLVLVTTSVCWTRDSEYDSRSAVSIETVRVVSLVLLAPVAFADYLHRRTRSLAAQLTWCCMRNLAVAAALAMQLTQVPPAPFSTESSGVVHARDTDESAHYWPLALLWIVPYLVCVLLDHAGCAAPDTTRPRALRNAPWTPLFRVSLTLACHAPLAYLLSLHACGGVRPK